MTDNRHEHEREPEFGRAPGDVADLPPADPRVTAALHAAAGFPPYDAVDWESMRASIVGDAAGILARRRQRGAWASYVVRWSRAALPAGLAAGVAAAVALAFAPLPSVMTEGMVAQTSTVTDEVLFGVVGGSVSRTALADQVTAPIRSAFEADAALGVGR